MGKHVRQTVTINGTEHIRLDAGIWVPARTETDYIGAHSAMQSIRMAGLPLDCQPPVVYVPTVISESR